MKDDVLTAINEINQKSVTNPDLFRAIILKSNKRLLVRPLQTFFHSFLAMVLFPSKLKKGKLCPIHSRGSREDANIYRHISLTTHISNVIELIVRRKLIAFLKEKILTDRKHGFRQRRICLKQTGF